MDIPFLSPLSTEDQRRIGIEHPVPLAVADRVRSSELDPLNHVNNAVYMQWFEGLRMRHAQDCGILRFGDARDPRTVIRSGNIHYHQEIKRDEVYAVTCRCSAFRRTSYSLEQQIWAGGTLRATFDCVMVLLEPDGNARYVLPDEVKHWLIDIDGATVEV